MDNVKSGQAQRSCQRPKIISLLEANEEQQPILATKDGATLHQMLDERTVPHSQRVMLIRRNNLVAYATAVYRGGKYRFYTRLARTGRQSKRGGSPAIAS